MTRKFDPTTEDDWYGGPLLEVHIRFSSFSLDELTQPDIDILLAQLGINGLYNDCTLTESMCDRTKHWDGTKLSYGIWKLCDDQSLAVKVIQNRLVLKDLMLLVPPRQMEELLGASWFQKLEQFSPEVGKLHIEIINAIRRLHAHASIRSAMISEETWFYQIPTNGHGIYVATLAAEAIDPQRIVEPSDENLANVQCGKPGLRIIPLNPPPSAS